MNQVFLVGRLTKDFTIKEKEDKKSIAYSTLAIQRPYKNDDGEYLTDFIDFATFGGVATNSAEYCKKGDLVGIKGYLSTYDKKLQVSVEKITFLSKVKEKESEYDKIDMKM